MFALILFPAFADRDKIKVSATYADLQPGSSCSDPDTDLSQIVACVDHPH
jgi:hypothetical protein